ncbi:MAG TPA: hypothetical protein VMG40_12695 [Bryobacteraceae bacterium]|nr:hypothetical protein [Bryobacteraceae bacterium]
MARGWESKSVEEQVRSARERQSGPLPRLDPQQLEIERQRDSLLLQRTRVLHQLEACADPRYRKTLASGLDFLETQLAKLGWQRPMKEC